MISKLLLAISIVLLSIGFWVPGDVHALLLFVRKSVDCTQFLKGGTNLTDNEQAFVCGIALKEIATKCTNPAGNAQNANETNSAFKLNGMKLNWTTADGTIKTKNGTRPIDVTITDDDIRMIVNEWNYDCLNGRGPAGCQVVDLSSGLCPNTGWTFDWAVSRADAIAISVIRPAGGSNDFQPCTLRYYPASVDPRVDPNGPDIVECIPNQDIFKDCRREKSGLSFYDVAHTPVPPGNKAFIQECVILRDVNNNNPEFDLKPVGTYEPDLAHLFTPFDGTSDKGGLWLTDFVKGSYYTGTCHQHGKEQVGGGKTPSVTWKQDGPLKPQYDSSGKPIAGTGDPSCTGGSQLLDGIDYNTDGVLP